MRSYSSVISASSDCAQFKVAPRKFASIKFAPVRSALVRSAVVKIGITQFDSAEIVITQVSPT